MQVERAQHTAPLPVLLAVLDIVIEQPTWRGEIVRRVERKYGHVLPRSPARIRIVINRAIKDGLLKEMDEADDTGEPPLSAVDHAQSRSRVCISATALGARTYREWRSEAPAADIIELGQRLNAAGEIGAKLAIIDGFEASCLDSMARLPMPGPSASLDAELLHEHQRLTLEAGVKVAAYARTRIAAGA